MTPPQNPRSKVYLNHPNGNNTAFSSMIDALSEGARLIQEGKELESIEIGGLLVYDRKAIDEFYRRFFAGRDYCDRTTHQQPELRAFFGRLDANENKFRREVLGESSQFHESTPEERTTFIETLTSILRQVKDDTK